MERDIPGHAFGCRWVTEVKARHFCVPNGTRHNEYLVLSTPAYAYSQLPTLDFANLRPDSCFLMCDTINISPNRAQYGHSYISICRFCLSDEWKYLIVLRVLNFCTSGKRYDSASKCPKAVAATWLELRLT